MQPISEKRNDKSNDEEKEEKSSGNSVVQYMAGAMRRRMSFCNDDKMMTRR